MDSWGSVTMGAIEVSIKEQKKHLMELLEQHAATYAFEPETEDGKIAKMLLLDTLDTGVESTRAELRTLRARHELATIEFYASPEYSEPRGGILHEVARTA